MILKLFIILCSMKTFVSKIRKKNSPLLDVGLYRNYLKDKLISKILFQSGKDLLLLVSSDEFPQLCLQLKESVLIVFLNQKHNDLHEFLDHNLRAHLEVKISLLNNKIYKLIYFVPQVQQTLLHLHYCNTTFHVTNPVSTVKKSDNG